MFLKVEEMSQDDYRGEIKIPDVRRQEEEVRLKKTDEPIQQKKHRHTH